MKEMKCSELCRSQLFWQQVKAFVTGEVRLSSGLFLGKGQCRKTIAFSVEKCTADKYKPYSSSTGLIFLCGEQDVWDTVHG